MDKRKIGRDVILTAIGLIAGGVLGFLASDHFYEKGRADIRESLLDAAISDIESWQSEDAHPMLHDSAGYAVSGKPWPKLSVYGIDELSGDMHSFKHFDEFEVLRVQVRDCYREVEDFNDRMMLRNISIVIREGQASLMSPKAYHRFQSEVLPAADSLFNLLKHNKIELIGDGTDTHSKADGELSWYKVLKVMLSLAGLIGLWVYVHKTTSIAKTSAEHNMIITRPAVTVKLWQDEAHPWQLDRIRPLVENHTSIHAKMRILIEYEVMDKLKDVTLKITTPIKTGSYSGKEVWNIGAKDKFRGNTSLEKLVGRQLKTNETVILNISADVSPFDRDDYRPIPLRQYIWKSETSEWVPYPVPKK